MEELANNVFPVKFWNCYSIHTRVLDFIMRRIINILLALVLIIFTSIIIILYCSGTFYREHRELFTEYQRIKH